MYILQMRNRDFVQSGPFFISYYHICILCLLYSSQEQDGVIVLGHSETTTSGAANGTREVYIERGKKNL